jgi:glycosyltransferase involved in cell wall biosynthesis
MADMETMPTPMEVLLMIDEDVSDRLGIVIRHLCVGAIDEGVRVQILSQSSRLEVGDAIGPSPVAYLQERSWPWPSHKPDEVLRRIGGRLPGLVHCLSVAQARRVEKWASAWNSAMLVHLTDLEDVREFGQLSYVEKLYAAVTTQTLHDAFVKDYPQYKDRVELIPFGIPAQGEPACLAQPDRLPVGVITTPLTRDCGLDHVFHALKAVIESGHQLHVLIISAGPAEKSFRKLADDLGVRGHMTFTGPVGDWAKLRVAMVNADFYILPASRRRFTISTLLAMADGLAILAPSGTIGDYLIDGETAALFDPQNPQDLAEKWIGMLDDRTRARQLAHRTLDYVKSHHKASTMVNRVTMFYRSIQQATAPKRPSSSTT